MRYPIPTPIQETRDRIHIKHCTTVRDSLLDVDPEPPSTRKRISRTRVGPGQGQRDVKFNVKRRF